MDENLKQAAAVIRQARCAIALTGAGISTESGIPDFRSHGGLWEKYDPAIYATIDTFIEHPAKSWEMIFDMIAVCSAAQPNDGHRALADLETMGFLQAIITQNIDNLHQDAGSRKVIEYHGNVSQLECRHCRTRHRAELYNLAAREVPRCNTCDAILKPSVVFFGEMIPREAMAGSQALAEKADVVLVVGTSAVVYPAAGIPVVAKQNDAMVIEFNLEPTALTRYVSDIFIEGPAGASLPALIEILRGV